MSVKITEFLNSKSEDVKLKAEKIELNKVDDVVKQGATLGGSLKGLEMDILSLANKIKKEAEKYNSYISELKKYIKSADELGLEDVKKNAQEAINHYEDWQKRADKMQVNVSAAIKR